MASDVDDRVLAMAAETFGVDPGTITGASTPDDVESWDSLAMLNLLIALEDDFGISLPPDQFGEAKSIDSIVSIVAAHLH